MWGLTGLSVVHPAVVVTAAEGGVVVRGSGRGRVLCRRGRRARGTRVTPPCAHQSTSERAALPPSADRHFTCRQHGRPPRSRCSPRAEKLEVFINNGRALTHVRYTTHLLLLVFGSRGTHSGKACVVIPAVNCCWWFAAVDAAVLVIHLLVVELHCGGALGRQSSGRLVMISTSDMKGTWRMSTCRMATSRTGH